MASITIASRLIQVTVVATFALSAGCDPSSFDMPEQRDGSVDIDPHSMEPAAAADAGSDAWEPLIDAGFQGGSSAWVDARSEPARPADASSEVPRTTRDAALRDADTACDDTLRDPKNCGSCGYDCSAPESVVSCVNGTCNRSCTIGFGDCDNDHIHGSAGNGCETRVVADVNNCGACRKRCVAPEYGFATCKNQLCSGHTLTLKDPIRGLSHGGTTGGAPFTLACAPGEVVTGISGLGDDSMVFAFRVHCARLEMKRTSGVINVSARATWMTEMAGGVNLVPVASFSRTCPPNTIVTKVNGSTFLFNGSAIVQRLSLSCSAIKVDAALRVTLEAGPTLQIGKDAAASLEVFNASCTGVGAVAGFSGRSGAYLDAVAVHCGQLQLGEAAASSVTVSADAANSSNE